MQAVRELPNYIADITTNKLHGKFRTAQSSLCSVYSNAENSNTQYMSYSQKGFGRTMNEKCWSVKPYCIENTWTAMKESG